MRFSARQDVISITPLNPFDRFEDGRPRVPDELLERMKLVEMEQAWAVLQKHEYYYQFDRDWVNLHPDRIMIGRALTATMVPTRPDLNDVVLAQGKREGRHLTTPGRWVLNAVVENDVIVVDIFGKVQWGCFMGDVLASGVSGQGGVGLVIDGGIRDKDGISAVPNINVFCRGCDPTTGKDITLISLNGPTRIGQATALPGDIVMGTSEGVIFIPPHLVEEIIAYSEDLRIREAFEKQRLLERKYLAYQIYGAEWGDELKADFEKWSQQHQRKQKAS